MDAHDTTGCARTDDDIPPVPPVEWDPNCSCLVCRAFLDSWAMNRLEQLIMNHVGDAIALGWGATALVGEVGRLALRGPYAEEIVTIALIAHAGHWLSLPDMADDLDEVDELAEGSIHDVGLTIPGWLDRYGTTEVDVDLALDGVVDLIEILSSLSDPPPSRRRRTLRRVPRD